MTRFTKVRLRLLVFSGLFVALVVFGLSSLGAVNRVVAQLDTVPPASHLPLIYRQAPPEITTIVDIVQPGDTLFSIARFGTTVSLLVELNNLADPNVIRVGQELLVPVTVTPTPTVTPTVTPTGTVTTTPTATVTPTVPATPVWTDPAVAIELLSPPASGLYHSPIEVIGFSQTFEGSVNLRLTAQDGAVLAERNTLGGSVDGFNFFHTYLRFTVTEPISATLEVFEISAKDGSEIHKVTRSLLLLPGQRVVDINTPRVGAVLCNPILVGGYSNTFEAVVSLALTERSGAVISQTIAMGGNLGVYSDFSALFDTPVAAPQPRLVSAYEEAASGQGPIDRTSIPVSLYPAGSGPCP